MNKAIYLTLADAYASNISAHDSALKTAVKAASSDVGLYVTILALANNTFESKRKIAA